MSADLDPWTTETDLLAMAKDRIAELEARVAELERALQPFARRAELWGDDKPSNGAGVKVKLDDCRAAAAALQTQTRET